VARTGDQCQAVVRTLLNFRVGGLLGQLGDSQLILLGLSKLWHRKNIDIIRIKI
jgi:hypothetical protein